MNPCLCCDRAARPTCECDASLCSSCLRCGVHCDCRRPDPCYDDDTDAGLPVPDVTT